MSSSLPLQTLFLGVSFFAGSNFVAIFKSAGLGSLIESAVSTGAIPVKETYTGLKPVDGFLSALVSFFWPVLDGSDPRLTLGSFHFMGQVAAIWMLVMLETSRRGNNGRLVSYAVPFGLLIQSIGYAVATPLWVAAYLISPPALTTSTLALLPSSGAAATIPLSVTLGFGLPTFLTTLPTPSILDMNTKLAIIAAWMIFPVYTGLAQQVLKRILPLPTASQTGQPQSSANAINTLRVTYISAMLTASITHVATLSISLTATLFPTIFAPGVSAYFHPKGVFLPSVPPSVLVPTKFSAPGEGVDSFLSYDQMFGSGALLIWALWNLTRAWSPRGVMGLVKGLAAAFGLVLTGGIAGLAIGAVWWRDEVVFASPTGKGEVGGKKKL